MHFDTSACDYARLGRDNIHLVPDYVKWASHFVRRRHSLIITCCITSDLLVLLRRIHRMPSCPDARLVVYHPS